ncbi:PREDICTED: probable serine hydrolase isoform X2 [Ceratosolen solmsi marchali]|uniref:Probable serine hydrolase isoform X2 n=1 Tax=Ceratosolen solmsi marchali TaxID=326594 RepID=A0AAJ6YEP8_9HYME|nr:PREDICTED: probable serine hydrolase isoform X2 [Ceratosolen solmsi marchali]
MNDSNDVDDRKSFEQSNVREFEEVHIPVPWGYISGKWWGPKEKQPILALHGREDNAGSFDNLIPLLSTNTSVLCLDLPGHGLSSHFPKGHLYYMYWEGINLLRRIIKHYKWNKIKLLGHSLGGAISFMYAASFPEEVDFVISLDIVSPSVKNINDCAKTTGDQVDKFLKYENLMAYNVPCYEYSVMIDIVHNAYKGSITRKSAEILMKRGMQPAIASGKYYFSRDPRLKVALLGMLSLDLAIAYASQIKCAYLNIRAVPGMIFDEPENYQKVLEIIKINSRRFEYHEVEGTHHVHLNNPEKVAPIINEFLRLQ